MGEWSLILRFLDRYQCPQTRAEFVSINLWTFCGGTSSLRREDFVADIDVLTGGELDQWTPLALLITSMPF